MRSQCQPGVPARGPTAHVAQCAECWDGWGEAPSQRPSAPRIPRPPPWRSGVPPAAPHACSPRAVCQSAGGTPDATPLLSGAVWHCASPWGLCRVGGRREVGVGCHPRMARVCAPQGLMAVGAGDAQGARRPSRVVLDRGPRLPTVPHGRHSCRVPVSDPAHALPVHLARGSFRHRQVCCRGQAFGFCKLLGSTSA